MGGGFLRALFRLVVFVLFLSFLFVEILQSGATTSTAASTTTTTTTTTTRKGSFKHLEVMERDRAAFHPDLDPNYMSKRKVPNGPDPIHNRRAGKSRQPPGRA